MKRFLYEPNGKMYRKYRHKVESLRQGMVMESNVRKREAEIEATEEIAGTSGTSNGNGMHYL